jgi:hypothetical protein
MQRRLPGRSDDERASGPELGERTQSARAAHARIRGRRCGQHRRPAHR